MENSSFGRLISVLTSPGKTFESIRERPTWLVAFVVTCVFAGGLGFLSHQRTDYRELNQHQMEASGQDVSAAQMEQMVEMQEKIGGIAIPFVTPVFLGVIMALIALIYWVGGKLGGSEPGYKQMFSMAIYAGAPTLIFMLLQMVMILPKETLPVEQIVTRNFLPASSLAIFAPDGASSKLVAFLSSLNFFSIWGLVLTFIGLKIVGKMSGTMAGILTAVVYLIALAFGLLFA